MLEFNFEIEKCAQKREKENAILDRVSLALAHLLAPFPRMGILLWI